MQGDARVEKDESHAGKVVERHWFDKNKHIFPASRWEVYDPTKDYGAPRAPSRGCPRTAPPRRVQRPGLSQPRTAQLAPTWAAAVCAGGYTVHGAEVNEKK